MKKASLCSLHFSYEDACGQYPHVILHVLIFGVIAFKFVLLLGWIMTYEEANIKLEVALSEIRWCGGGLLVDFILPPVTIVGGSEKTWGGSPISREI